MPSYFEIDSLFAALIGGLIIGILSMVLDNIFGLTPPIIDGEAYRQEKERIIHSPIEGIGFIRENENHVPSYVENTTVVAETAVSTTIVNSIAQAATEEE